MMTFLDKIRTGKHPPTGKAGPRPGRRTRLSSVWVSLVLAAIVLVLLLIFILENSNRIDIAYFGAHGHLPLGVALLFAAVLGILLVAVPGTGRIIQLRRTARQHQKAAKQAKSGQPEQGRPQAPAPLQDDARNGAIRR